MQIHNLILGDYETNSYCLTATESSTDCVIIDTGLESEPLIDFLRENELNPLAVIFTHGHADHIMGVTDLRKNYPDIKVIIHKADAEMLTRPSKNLSPLTGCMFKADAPDIIIADEEPIEFAGIKFQVFHTPGHTPGGICLYCKDESVIFVGDTLFAGSIGRTDFPGGDFKKLIASIKQKLLTLPGQTKVYTGHGDETTIQAEKQYNQFLI